MYEFFTVHREGSYDKGPEDEGWKEGKERRGKDNYLTGQKPGGFSFKTSLRTAYSSERAR